MNQTYRVTWTLSQSCYMKMVDAANEGEVLKLLPPNAENVKIYLHLV